MTTSKPKRNYRERPILDQFCDPVRLYSLKATGAEIALWKQLAEVYTGGNVSEWLREAARTYRPKNRNPASETAAAFRTKKGPTRA